MAAIVTGTAQVVSFAYAGGGTFTNLNGGANFPSGALVLVGILCPDQAASVMGNPKIGGIAATIVPGTNDTSDNFAVFQAVMPADSPDTFSFETFLNYVGASPCYLTGVNSTVSDVKKLDMGAGGADPQSAAAATVPGQGIGVVFGFAHNPALNSANTLTWTNTTSGSGDSHAQNTTDGDEIGFAHTLTSGSWTPTVAGNALVWSFIGGLAVTTWASGTVALTPGLVTNTNKFPSVTVTGGTVVAQTNTKKISLWAGDPITPANIILRCLPVPAARAGTSIFLYAGQGTPSNIQLTDPTVANSADKTLLPGLVSNSQTFYAPTVAPGAVSVLPGLVTNSQTFYAPTVLATYSLTPGLVTNSQTFYAPTVSPGAVALTPGLVTNSQTFYAPTETNVASVLPGLVSNSQTFYAPTVATSYTLTPGLVTNSQTFYAPTVSPGAVALTPSLVSNSQTFYAPTVANSVGLTPGLVTNSQTFYAATVTPGAVALTPGLVSNSQTFYAPTVAPGAVSVLPGLVTNSQTFYAPTVGSSYGLSPGLVSNSQTFFSPAVLTIYPLTPGLVTNTQTFFAPSVTTTYALTPGLVTNSQSFQIPSVSAGDGVLLPGLVTNSQTFYAPTVSPGAVNVAPGLVTATQTFYAATVGGSYALTPSLVSNSQTFYAPTIGGSYGLTPGLVTNSQTFYAPTETNVASVLPGLVSNSQTFYAPSGTPGSVGLTPSKVTNNQTFSAPSVLNTNVVVPSLVTAAQTFYAPAVTTVASILSALVTDADAFYDMSFGTGSIFPGLLSDSEVFYAPVLGKVITAPVKSDSDQIFSPTIVPGPVTVGAPVLVDADEVLHLQAYPKYFITDPGFVFNLQ